MNRFWKAAVLVWGIAPGATACSPMYLAWRPPVDIGEYHGDGTIARLPHPINPGFAVSFESFPLDAAFGATYSIRDLPKPRHHSAYRVGLAVDLSAEELSGRWPHVPAWLRTAPVGTLAVSVRDGANRLVLECEAEVANLYWQWRGGDVPLGVIRREEPPACDTARIPPDRPPEEKPASVTIAYTPGTNAPRRVARLRVMAGGFD